MAKLSEFGRQIKIRLMEKDKTQVWLMDEIQKKTGLYIDYWYLWRIMHGTSTTTGIVQAIKEILEMED